IAPTVATESPSPSLSDSDQAFRCEDTNVTQ
ncbi:hypothetical protein CCACVL1_23579, partial [Corchorus capsularis]